ncbi:putative bifunctional diguanylate cyclase/phosphodiesterase [Rubellimicrobium aerolatum]|uniref:Bifunctional diguanylate cyclase/phosphodiesterase n=1 Tax=Rubellimicrobium aerolatum TaxID=490979 RepID=A0ABW0SDQ3_9RHOB
MHRLPSRIVAVMIATILISVLTVGASNLWLSRSMDHQAREQSLAQVRSAADNLLTQVRLTIIDYAKWEGAVDGVAAADLDWVYENIGTAATTGQTAQIVLFWGGRYGGDLGWNDEGLEEPRSGLLDPGTIGLAESLIAKLPVGVYDGVQFFAWHDGGLFALGAARLEKPEQPNASSVPDEDLSRLLMGRRVTEAALAEVADGFMLKGLGVVREEPTGRLSVPLPGGDGRPVAWLAWDKPQPGTTLLWRLASALVPVVLLTAGLAGLGMMLVRRGAQDLLVTARTDAMTGLPNRAAFNSILAVPGRAGERAILFLDVNDFKRINDSIGHEAGDQVIAGLARRLNRLAGPDLILARIAGDEFVFVVTGPDAEQRTLNLAELARAALEEPFGVLGHQLQISLSMGYAVQADDDTLGFDLVRQADLAMYEAKRHKGQPGTGLVGFSAVIAQASRDALALEQGLRRALAHPGELSVAYQPIVGPDGRLERAEALARWTSRELGAVPPDRFIAVAEQAGLIVELGRQLFQLVCDDLVAHPDLRVSLNISPLQLMAPDFIASLVRELCDRHITPERIEIELTEAVVVDDPRLAAERLEELRRAGFSIALDDFGTGYSSVGYLEQFRFDTLKIDRSFVSKIRGSAKGVRVVDAMIMMAHGLDLRVVCEGIETADELELLRDLGCDLAQGFHLDRPLPIGALAARWLGGRETQVAVA